jgi:hypothetical protein
MQNLRKFFPISIFDLLAIAILTVFCLLSFSLMHHESATTDEQAHIPAAYSYVMLDDFTLNPEHPPLAKLISGIGFIGSHYTFPTNLLHQNNSVGMRQWAVGTAFLYHSGNNPDSILMRSRLPILIASTVGLLVCYLLFCTVSSKRIALMALIFTALSPTVIAHGHLVTTDILIMTTTTIAILCFIRYLQKPSRAYALIAGATLAIAELSKFSAALLFAFYPLAALLFYRAQDSKTHWKKLAKRAMNAVLPLFIVALLIMYIVYSFQVIHLSHVAQDVWITQAAGDSKGHLGGRILHDMNQFPPAAPLVRYIVGFASSLVRVAVGHGANLLGKDYSVGTPIYFPVVSLLKTPAPLIVLWALIVVYAWRRLNVLRAGGEKLRKILWHLFLRAVRTEPIPAFGGLFTAIYFLVACAGSLDIGVRHLLPLFPWIALFSSLWMAKVLENQAFKKIPIGKIASGSIIGLFVLISMLVYPNYIPYTTEFAGGASQDYRYYNDSNVDWGQSIKYVASYANKHPQILPLYTDQNYVDAKSYYLCGPSGNCPSLRPLKDTQRPPRGSYFAVSEMRLTIAWASGNSPLDFLKNKKPVAKIGDSTYLYYIQK